MTACGKTITKRRGASLPRAIVLLLAGVLAAGLIPALAFAAPEAEGADEAAPIELQASDEDAWNAGEITAAKDNEGNELDLSAMVEFAADGNAHFVVPTEITPFAAGEAKEIEDGYNATLALYAYDSTTSGVAKYSIVTNPADVNVYAAAAFYGAIAAPGDIYLKDGVFYSDSGLNYTVPVVEFEIVAQDIAAAELYQRVGDAKDFSDTEYIFNGASGLVFGNFSGDLALHIDEHVLVPTVDYNVTTYKVEGASKVAGPVVGIGQYEAVIEGLGAYAGTETIIAFEVKPIDLATYGLWFQDQVVGWTEPTSGTDLIAPPDSTSSQDTAVMAAIKSVTYASGPAGSEYTTARTTTPGHFVYDVTLDPANADVVAGNIINNATVEFDVAGEHVPGSKFFYNDVEMGSLYPVYDVTTDFSDAEPVLFDESLIAITPTTEVTLDASNVTYTVYCNVYDTETSSWTYIGTVDIADVTSVPEGYPAARYVIDVVIDAASTDYAYSGGSSMFVEVYKDEISSANVFITYEGQNVDFPTFGVVPYDPYGTDYLEKFETTVTATDGTVLEAGVDYNIVTSVYDAEAGEWVEWVGGFVDAGVYLYAIESDSPTYALDFANAYVILVVEPYTIDLDYDSVGSIDGETVYAAELTGWIDMGGSRWYDYQYMDGEEIVPGVEFFAGLYDEYGAPIFETLDPAEYQFEIFKQTDENFKEYASEVEVDAIAEPGRYRVILEAADEGASGNYVLKNDFEVTVYVYDGLPRFTDVDYDTPGWYADYVTYCATTYNGAGALMSGYAGTTIFGVGNTMLRSEVAQVLLNLAGQPSDPTDANMTPLKDVEDEMWYTTAINFAYGAGVITGYTSGDQAGNFGVYDNVSREQFATMLYRFAKTFAPAIYEEIPLAEALPALRSYGDADQISEYAAPALAWCIEKGIMSGYAGTTNLGPQDTILREQVAKMVAVFDQANKGVL